MSISRTVNSLWFVAGVFLVLLAWLVATDQGLFPSQESRNAEAIKENRMELEKIEKTLNDRGELFKHFDAELKRLKQERNKP